MITGYLGPDGTYTEIAHDKLYKDTVKRQFANFYSIFKAVENAEIDAGVVPLENALEGSVTQCLDLLFQSDDVFVTAQTYVSINHRLLIKKGALLSDIKTVYSHEQAIRQCGHFLSEKLKDAKLVFTSSTSASAQLIKNSSEAAIVGSHFKKDGFIFYDADIADRNYNETRFGVIEKGADKMRADASKVLVAAGSENRPGALLELLSALNDQKLNMTKIESRPLKTRLGEYVFFIEFDGCIFDEKVKQTLKLLQKLSPIFKILGSYN